MNLYVETSAVVAWLLDEEHDDGTRAQPVAADVTFTSDLTPSNVVRPFVAPPRDGPSPSVATLGSAHPLTTAATSAVRL